MAKAKSKKNATKVIRFHLVDPKALYDLIEYVLPDLQQASDRLARQFGVATKGFRHIYLSRDNNFKAWTYKAVINGMYLGVIRWRPRKKCLTVQGQFFEDNIDEVVAICEQLKIDVELGRVNEYLGVDDPPGSQFIRLTDNDATRPGS